MWVVIRGRISPWKPPSEILPMLGGCSGRREGRGCCHPRIVSIGIRVCTERYGALRESDRMVLETTLMQGAHGRVQLRPLRRLVFINIPFFRPLSSTFGLPLWYQGPEREVLLQSHTITGFTDKWTWLRKLRIVIMRVAHTILEEGIDMHGVHPTLQTIRHCERH